MCTWKSVIRQHIFQVWFYIHDVWHFANSRPPYNITVLSLFLFRFLVPFFVCVLMFLMCMINKMYYLNIWGLANDRLNGLCWFLHILMCLKNFFCLVFVFFCLFCCFFFWSIHVRMCMHFALSCYSLNLVTFQCICYIAVCFVWIFVSLCIMTFLVTCFYTSCGNKWTLNFYVQFITTSPCDLPPMGKWVTVQCASRIDLSGGWTDTPPITYEFGGAVIDAAILLDGERKIGAKIKRIPE